MRDGRLWGWVAWGLSLIVSCTIAVKTWETVRTRQVRTVDVTGSAKKRIKSDLALWRANVHVINLDPTVAYKELAGHVKKTQDYLRAQGIKDEEMRGSSISREEVFDEQFETTRTGEHVQKRVFKGFRLAQGISIQSTDVARVERLSREVTGLLESGVPVDSETPQYLYTRLGEVKIEMLAEASKDARVRAERMVQAAGAAQLGKLRKADMGVINVNPANSTDTSWGGNNDTGSVDKDIITIVHVSFDLGE
jgi:hypothetical protein